MSRLTGNNYFRLTRVLLKGEGMDNPATKSRRILVHVLGLFAVLCIIIPACILVGAISYIATVAVMEVSGDEQGMAMILMFIAAFSVIFGISVILNVFYFSNDSNYILPLPFQPWEIIAAKFTTAYINESVMEFLVIISAVIGYIVASGVSVAKIILSVFAMITIPIIPLVYCGIFCIICMTFTGFIKNKDAVNKFTGIATMLFVCVVLFIATKAGGINMDDYAVSFVKGTNSLYNVMSTIFVHIPLICKAMSGSIAAFSGYVAINVICVALFLVIAQKLYFIGVIGLAGSAKTGKQSTTLYIEKHSKQRSAGIAYLLKELKMMVRTPAFMTNCVLINFIWPVLMIVVYKMQSNGSLLLRLADDYRMGNEKMSVYVPVVVMVVSLLVASANSIASSAVTREGMSFPFMKYSPLPLDRQVRIKAVCAMLITQPVMALYVIAVSVFLHAGIVNTIYYVIISFQSVWFVTYMGIVLDTVHPKLLWEDEINALRGNATVFFAMANSMLLGGLLVLAAFVLLEFTKLSTAIINGVLFVIMLMLDIVAYINCIYTAGDNLEDI